jgi:hypothetical protein
MVNNGIKVERAGIIDLSIMDDLIGASERETYVDNKGVERKRKRDAALEKMSKFLPISQDEKKELEVVNLIVGTLTKNDNQERKFLVLLQNNAELRPGGGFLGQYAIIKIKNGEVISTYVEDANLLDQRITAKVSPPYPFKRMIQLKSWKLLLHFLFSLWRIALKILPQGEVPYYFGEKS